MLQTIKQHIFEKKLRAGDIVDDGQQYWSETHPGKTKWQMDDFDPAYGLEGEVSGRVPAKRSEHGA